MGGLLVLGWAVCGAGRWGLFWFDVRPLVSVGWVGVGVGLVGGDPSSGLWCGLGRGVVRRLEVGAKVSCGREARFRWWMELGLVVLSCAGWPGWGNFWLGRPGGQAKAGLAASSWCRVVTAGQCGLSMTNRSSSEPTWRDRKCWSPEVISINYWASEPKSVITCDNHARIKTVQKSKPNPNRHSSQSVVRNQTTNQLSKNV